MDEGKKFNQFSTDNPQSDDAQVRAERGEPEIPVTDDDRPKWKAEDIDPKDDPAYKAKMEERASMERLPSDIQKVFKESRLDEFCNLLGRLFTERETNWFTPIMPEGAGRQLRSFMIECQNLNRKNDVTITDFENLSLRLKEWADSLNKFNKPKGGGLKDDSDNVRRIRGAMIALKDCFVGVENKLRVLGAPEVSEPLRTAIRSLENRIVFVNQWSRYLGNYLRR